MSLAFLISPPTPPHAWPEDRRTVRRLERPEDSEPFGEPEPKRTVERVRADHAANRAKVLQIMPTRGHWTLRELAKATDIRITTLHHLMRRLRLEGAVNARQGGGYWLPTKEE